MRRFLLAAVMCGSGVGAQAADMPDLPVLRGGFTDGRSARSVNWQGCLCRRPGLATASADMDFTQFRPGSAGEAHSTTSTSRPVRHLAMAAAATTHDQDTGFGAFVGYNSQWDDVVVGVEANYIHGKIPFGSSSGSPGLQVFLPTDVLTTTPLLIRAAVDELTDFGSLRVRGGYASAAFCLTCSAASALGRRTSTAGPMPT